MRGPVLALLVIAMPAQAAAPVVYRGSSAAVSPTGSAPAVPIALAGKRLWLLDPDGRAIISCASERTIKVGGRRIRCIGGTLP